MREGERDREREGGGRIEGEESDLKRSRMMRSVGEGQSMDRREGK